MGEVKNMTATKQNGLTQRAPDWWALCVRVFRRFACLGIGSVKMALSRPAHQRVTQAVGQRNLDTIMHLKYIY